MRPLRWLLSLLVLASPLAAQTTLDSVRVYPRSVADTVKWYTTVRTDTVKVSLPSEVAAHVLVGAWQGPADSLRGRYNTVLLGTANIAQNLAKVKAQGSRAVLYLNRRFSRDWDPILKDSVFSLAAVRRQLDSLPDLTPFVTDGTLHSVMVGDDITGKGIWGPGAPYLPQLDSASLLVKQHWGKVQTVIRATAAQLTGRQWKWTDGLWAQYGAFDRNGTVTFYRDREKAGAAALGLCYIFGVNVIDGGNGSSQISNSPNLWEMTPTEYLAYAKVLLPETAMFLHWQYRPATEARLLAAVTKVRAIADTTTPPAGACS